MKENGKGILILISDPRVSALVRELCLQHDSEVEVREYNSESVNYVTMGAWNLLIIYNGKETPDVVEVCRRARANHPYGQILVVVDAAAQPLGVRCLAQGADDLILTPWSDEEFSARISGAMRRSGQFQMLLKMLSIADSPITLPSPEGTRSESDSYSYLFAGDVRLCSVKREVSVHGAPVHLTRTEYMLFSYLLQRRDRLCSSGELLDMVLGYKDDSYLPSLHSHISRLRRKLSDSQTTSIDTIWCYGYRITIS